jgi:predicted Zn-ribbon and HTH transcriptional regulator
MAIFHKSSFCPNCKSGEIHRSRRRGLLENILHAVFFVSPYRCKTCDERYFRFRLPISPEAKPPHHAA